MNIQSTKFDTAFVLEMNPISDNRGFFVRQYCQNIFTDLKLNTTWKQINNSLSKEPYTLRGLHYQLNPFNEIKLVRCLKGAIWDVIVDLRKDSSTFGKWFAEELNEANNKMMYVPNGFAHGFLSLEPNSMINYLVSEFYSNNHEQSLLWCDDDLKINWPFKPLVISEKDKNAKSFKLTKPLDVSQ